MSTLSAQLTKVSHLSLIELAPDYPALRVEHPTCTATVALHGAHLIAWQPNGADPVLYNSPDSIYREGTAIRGGIPVCWPWFGAHPTDSSLPSHGFARNQSWELADVSESKSGVTLSFLLHPNENSKSLFPHQFETRYTLELSRTLKASLTTTNRGDQPFTIGGALHTYFAIGDVHRVQVEGLDAVSYLDCVGERTNRTQEGPIRFEREVDRIFHEAPVTTLCDDCLCRRIVITPTGSHSTVVWNPWNEKAAALGDMPDDDYHMFVCIETTNALEDVVALAPGESHTLGATISLADLP